MLDFSRLRADNETMEKIGLCRGTSYPNTLTALCQMLMLLVSSRGVWGSFTPNWAWGEEERSNFCNTASSSDEEYSFWRPSGLEYKIFPDSPGNSAVPEKLESVQPWADLDQRG